MKKVITLGLVLLLLVSLLSACGGGGSTPGSTPDNSVNNSAPSASDSGGNDSSPPASTPAATNPPIKRTVEVPDEPLDLTDDSIYFVIIDGVKIILPEATVQDFLNIGFVFGDDFDENSEVAANSAAYSGFNLGAEMFKEGTQALIYVYAVNTTDHSLPLKDCEIGTVYFDERIGSAFDISTVCNLSYGCTEEEIMSVLGDLSDDIFTQTAYGNNQIRYFAEGHGEFWFTTKDKDSGAFRQIGVHSAK